MGTTAEDTGFDARQRIFSSLQYLNRRRGQANFLSIPWAILQTLERLGPELTSELYLLPTLKYHTSGSKIVFRDQFQGDPWIHFCNTATLFTYFLEIKNNVLFNHNCGTSLISGVFISYDLYFFLWRYGPTRPMACSFSKFLDDTQQRTTVGRTPLDE
jgi:hypothetical protein